MIVNFLKDVVFFNYSFDIVALSMKYKLINLPRLQINTILYKYVSHVTTMIVNPIQIALTNGECTS